MPNLLSSKYFPGPPELRHDKTKLIRLSFRMHPTAPAPDTPLSRRARLWYQLPKQSLIGDDSALLSADGRTE